MRPKRLPFLPFSGRFRGLQTALALTGVLSACGNDATEPVDGDHLLTPAVEVEFRLGGFDAAGWDAFGDNVRATFDGEGRLLVLDPAGARVVVVDRRGELVREFGRRGGGPGELQFPSAITVLESGEIAVFDGGNMAFVIFDPMGTPLRNVPFDPQSGFPGSRLHAHPLGGVVSSPGGVVVRGPGMGEDQSGLPVRYWDLQGEGTPATWARIWRPPPGEFTTGSRGGSNAIRITAPPLMGFEPPASVAVLPDGRLAVVDSTTYRIKILEPAGDEAVAVGRAVAPRLVTQADRERERNRRMAELEAGDGPRMQVTMRSAGGGVVTADPEAVRNMQRERIEGMVFWNELPVLRRIAVDGEGRLWVERNDEEGQPGHTDLLSAGGTYLGTLPQGAEWIPEAFSLDGRAVYLVRDEWDVLTLEVRRLDGLPSGEG